MTSGEADTEWSRGASFRKGAVRASVEEALRQIQAGSNVEQHFEGLYRRFLPACRHFFVRRGLAQEADDLAQEVMLRVYRGIEGYQFRSSFDTWVAQIMLNVYRNWLRHSHSQKVRVEVQLPEEPSGEGAVIVESADPSAGPLETTIDAERRGRLGAALGALPPRMRQCIFLRYQGYKYREIAEIQGVAIDTVKRQLKLARSRMRPLLGAGVELFGLLCFLVML
ncbi:MAG: RNA polymerase sigma factor [Acidobacteriota bacterium]